MYDEKDNRYLDCINNVAHVGHCNKDVVEAATRQMAILNTNARFLHDNIVLLAQKLTSIFPKPLSVCFIVNSGSEANDLALRLAYTHTKNKDTIVLNHAYHGHSLAVIDLSPYKDGQGRDNPEHIHVAPCPDIYRGKHNVDNCSNKTDFGKKYAEDVKAICDDLKSKGRGVAAFFAESMMSCAGQIIPPPNYLKNVYKHVREAGGICVADEVQVGFGRVGKHWWAFQLQGDDVVPDIVTIGKPMGNGHPVAAVITTPEVAASFTNMGIEYFNTYGGNPVSCAVALEVLNVIEKEGMRENATTIGNYLKSKLLDLQKKHPIIGDVRGVGMFIGIELVKDRITKVPATAEAQHIISRLKEERILYSTDGPHRNVLKFKAPMCFNKDDADELLSKMEMIFSEIKDEDTPMRISVSAEAMVDSANGPLKSIHLPGESFESNESHELTTNGKVQT